MSEAELKEVYAFALDLSKKAGKILLDGIEKRTGEQSGRDVGVIEEKMNAVDIVCVPPLIQFKNANSSLRSLKQISVPHPSNPPSPPSN